MELCLFRWPDNSAVDGIVVAGAYVVELTSESEYFSRTDQLTSLVARVVRFFSIPLNSAENFICDVSWSFWLCQIWTFGKSSAALRSSVISLRKGPSCDGPLASFGDILDVRLKGKQFSEEQIICILKGHQVGLGAKELCHKHGISDATFYKW